MKILEKFVFGSHMYGTTGPNSDEDFYYITDDSSHNGEEFVDGNINYHLYSAENFQKALDRHEIGAMECWSSKPNDFVFVLDKVKLRHSISAVSSNSWVKAKKKLDKEKEPYIGKKSLFHSLRILKFGIQIATNEKVVDFTEANGYYNDIMNMTELTWQPYKDKYQQIYNGLSTEFKKLAPKE